MENAENVKQALERFGHLIREARVINGFSQLALATAIGCQSERTIAHIEHGRMRVPVARLSQLSTLLALDLDRLIEMHVEIEREIARAKNGIKRDANI